MHDQLARRRRSFLYAATAAVGAVWARALGFTMPRGWQPAKPNQAGWPTDREWAQLAASTDGALMPLASKLDACWRGDDLAGCDALFRNLTNPYFIGDDPALTQTLGWAGAWTSATSPYVIAARRTSDIVHGVNFARRHKLRLAVKGGGHSYLGTSNAADSLLIWTRHLNAIQIDDSFVPKGGVGKVAPRAVVNVGAGALWMHTYNAVTTAGGRYVQGGGCTTVGVAGLIQSGGFGSFSKFGLAASGLVEAEIVTADGRARIVNQFIDPDLFWALKGGGGSTFGIVTRLTLETHELPAFFGAANFMILARSDKAYRELISFALKFYRDSLFNPHWGEQMTFEENRLSVHMVFQGLSEDEAKQLWSPFLKSIADRPDDFTIPNPPFIRALPARRMWDSDFLRQIPGIVVADARPGAPSDNVVWRADAAEAGQFLHGYQSLWLPAELMQPGAIDRLVDALFRTTRHWSVSLHYNKGLAGAPADVISQASKTAMNPNVATAFALAIIAGGEGPAYPGVADREPHHDAARDNALAMDRAMAPLRLLAPDGGAYVSESNYFEKDWQRAFWGDHYARLLAIKRQYDPFNLFKVHHGVGSEDASGRDRAII